MIDPRLAANREHYVALWLIWLERAPFDRASCQARARAAWVEIEQLVTTDERIELLSAWKHALATGDVKRFKDRARSACRRVFGAL